MRISDWSSDVCSSDLHADPVGLALLGRRDRGEGFGHGRQIAMSRATCHPSPLAFRRQATAVSATERGPFSDRKSVVWGKSVSVRVDLGGRRIIKKKKYTT